MRSEKSWLKVNTANKHKIKHGLHFMNNKMEEIPKVLWEQMPTTFLKVSHVRSLISSLIPSSFLSFCLQITSKVDQFYRLLMDFFFYVIVIGPWSGVL